MLLVKLKCIHESFPSKHARSTDFTRSGKAYTSFNLLHILFFFYENYWPCLTWSSKCRGRVSHGNINFWFSGSASQRSTQTRMLYIEASSLSIVRSRETVPKEQNKKKRTQVDIVCYCNFIKVIKGPSTKNFRIS